MHSGPIHDRLKYQIDLNNNVYDSNNINGNNWIIENCDHSIVINGTVPGLVHTDLLHAGLLSPSHENNDPYYRFNELQQSWVSLEPCWIYRTEISSTSLMSLLQSDNDDDKNDKDKDDDVILLHINGLDTIGSIYWNNDDIPIGTTSNAFRSYDFDITKNILFSSSVHSLPNSKSSSLSSSSSPSDTQHHTLKIVISSAITYASSQAFLYPYHVPATMNYNVWVEPSSRNFIRKAGKYLYFSSYDRDDDDGNDSDDK